MNVIIVSKFYIKFKVFLQTCFCQITGTSDDRTIAMRMIYFFTKDIDFGMDILFRMNTHLNSTRNNVFYKLIHSVFNLFIILGFLNVFLYIIKEFFLRLVAIGIK